MKEVSEKEMDPQPEYLKKGYKGSEKLKDKVAIITGGDSGIGKAISILFAAEGASVLFTYHSSDKDAKKTLAEVKKYGNPCAMIQGDLSDSKHSKEIVDKAISEFGKIDIVINNAAVQFPQDSLTDITDEQIQKTFATNIFAYMYLCREALPHLKEGSSIINTTSVTAYKGNERLIDYSSTKGAIVSFTRSLSANLAHKKIRVNGVAPGPIWTPLIPSTFPKEDVDGFGKDVPLNRPGQPSEVAGCYLFLASDLGSYMTGQVLHPNGGEIINT
ncbi:SDR family oxidoreductase [uncultured Algoriphagus sp.]|uniref:SDR family oxidoreductase n=1 Tax=uncultured Algoriphagus sp. TaxID=417365 RepID=UPI0030EB298F|tara:strand:+ start:31681 stop:32499 length:819 start_codon:yes stop_codon:yes gene_type:complete